MFIDADWHGSLPDVAEGFRGDAQVVDTCLTMQIEMSAYREAPRGTSRMDVRELAFTDLLIF